MTNTISDTVPNLVPDTNPVPDSAPPAPIVVKPTPSLEGLLRNPGMGWVLYLETLNDNAFPDGNRYWTEADPYASTASIFYIRCTWAQMEPQEGHYAWNENAHFRVLIQGALQRHLKLAFRIVTNSKDCREPATPLWVQHAGAKGYMEMGHDNELWTPSLMDPVFRQKLENFVAAFAGEFDDPSRVDYIDGCGLGWWGEMHHLHLAEGENRDVAEWIYRTYGNAFHHVLLGVQFDSELGSDDLAFDQYGYVARIDSLGSSWLWPERRQKLMALYPKIPFFGESCYFALDGSDNWKKDNRHLQTVRDVLQAAYDDAIACHANTLDLRDPRDAATAMREGSDLVASFLAKGGYRLYPVLVEFPAKFDANHPVTIRHTWKNLGAGIMANDNPRWNRKYRVAFALLDRETKKVVSTVIDGQADPGAWATGQEVPNECSARFLPVPSPGNYQFAIAIVNTQNGNQPEIRMATADLPQSEGWSLLGNICVNAPPAPPPPPGPD